MPGRPGVGGMTGGEEVSLWDGLGADSGSCPDIAAPAAASSASDTPPSVPPFSLMMYATTAAYSSSLRDSGSSSGMVERMFSSNSRIGSLPQALRKLRPASSGASKSPLRLARWQSAHAERYTASPASACSWVYTGTAAPVSWPAARHGRMKAAAADAATRTVSECLGLGNTTRLDREEATGIALSGCRRTPLDARRSQAPPRLRRSTCGCSTSISSLQTPSTVSLVMSVTLKRSGTSTVPSQVPSASRTSHSWGRSSSLLPR